MQRVQNEFKLKRGSGVTTNYRTVNEIHNLSSFISMREFVAGGERVERFVCNVHVEYKGMMCDMYFGVDCDTLELGFSTDWSNDEIYESAGDAVLLMNLDEAGFFQQTLVQQLFFMDYEFYLSVQLYIKNMYSTFIEIMKDKYGEYDYEKHIVHPHNF